MPSTRHLTLLLFPGGLLLGLLIWWPRHPEILPQLQGVLQMASWPVLGIGALLAWRFNRIRLLNLMLLLAACLAVRLPAVQSLARYDVLPLWNLLLPINVLLLALLPEWGILSLRALVYPLLLVLELVALASWSGLLPARFSPYLAHLQSLPGSLVLAAAVTLLLIWKFLRAPQPMNGYFCWLPITFWGVTALGLMSLPLAWSLIAIGAIIALLENSYVLAYRDDLTGLPGRRALNEQLPQLPRHYVIAMVDIDHFKQFNDKHGHDVGDQVLKMVATKLGGVRCGGRACRYGGEEFAVLFPGRDQNEAAEELERLRGVIEQSRFVTRHWRRPKNKPKTKKPASRSPRQLRVTVSIGLASRGSGETPEAVLKRADQALYRAKRAGRNQVMG